MPRNVPMLQQRLRPNLVRLSIGCVAEKHHSPVVGVVAGAGDWEWATAADVMGLRSAKTVEGESLSIATQDGVTVWVSQ